MKSNDTRVSRWWTLGSAALGLAAVAAIGLASITPARADWDHHGWHHHDHVGFGFSVGTPGYAYNPYYYPAYPAYPAYGYPYAYGPSYYGPSFSIGIGVH
jgi:hypothetical protein